MGRTCRSLNAYKVRPWSARANNSVTRKMCCVNAKPLDCAREFECGCRYAHPCCMHAHMQKCAHVHTCARVHEHTFAHRRTHWHAHTHVHAPCVRTLYVCDPMINIRIRTTSILYDMCILCINMSTHVTVCVYVCVYMYTLYIYIYREREREGDNMCILALRRPRVAREPLGLACLGAEGKGGGEPRGP